MSADEQLTEALEAGETASEGAQAPPGDWDALFPEIPAPASLGAVLAGLGRLEHAVRSLETNVAALTEKIDRAEQQIGHVVDLAGPAIEQISKSPLMKLLGGKGAAKSGA